MGRRAEGILGKTLPKLAKREDYMTITKGHPKKPEDILGRCLPRSLAQLQTDYVDGWFFHGLDDPSILTSPEWKAAAEKAKKSGKTRFFGFSCHGKNVVELLTSSAKVGFIDVIMLKYNFRSYGDVELNRAIDAAYKADVGLIAMKTQGAAVSLAEHMNPFEQAGYNKHQAVLKAVWRDERIASCCSEMPSLKILEENAAAATQPLTTREARLVRDWAERTAGLYCPGGSGVCRRQCEAALDQPAAIADTLRCLMYHDSYGRRGDARELFAQLPDSLRPSLDIDLAAAERACPLRLPVARFVRDALGRLRYDSAAAAEGLCV
jgi:predicted aldo/keto reductase-like oxidoreductase